MKNYIKNGLIIVNKPKSLTSHDVVKEIRKFFPNIKVGHTGTLDPMTTGVLLVCIGKATRLSRVLNRYDKEYIAEIELGYETDTLDGHGEIVKKLSKGEISKRLEKITNLRKVINKFVGEISQIPPIYSAIKYKGEELYKITRRERKVRVKPRNVNIYKIQLIDKIGDSIFKIKVICSSGTYIRALARDIARSLGTYATLIELVRTKVGNYKIENSYKLEQLKKLYLKAMICKVIIPISQILSGFEKVIIKDFCKKMIKNGAPLSLNMIKNVPFKCKSRKELVVLVKEEKIVGIYKTFRDIDLKPESTSRTDVAKAWIMLN